MRRGQQRNSDEAGVTRGQGEMATVWMRTGLEGQKKSFAKDPGLLSTRTCAVCWPFELLLSHVGKTFAMVPALNPHTSVFKAGGRRKLCLDLGCGEVSSLWIPPRPNNYTESSPPLSSHSLRARHLGLVSCMAGGFLPGGGKAQLP